MGQSLQSLGHRMTTEVSIEKSSFFFAGSIVRKILHLAGEPCGVGHCSVRKWVERCVVMFQRWISLPDDGKLPSKGRSCGGAVVDCTTARGDSVDCKIFEKQIDDSL
jgi:hypothetical protein